MQYFQENIEKDLGILEAIIRYFITNTGRVARLEGPNRFAI